METLIQQFVITHYDDIYQECRNVVQLGFKGNTDAVNDVSQEVCLALLDPQKNLNFPAGDKVGAFRYIRSMAKHFWFAIIKQQKPLVEMNERSHGAVPYDEIDEQDVRRLPGIEALQELNNRIIDGDLLSPAQQDLWLCIMEMMPKRQIMEKLGLTSKRVDNYRHKLFVILRKNFNQEDYM